MGNQQKIMVHEQQIIRKEEEIKTNALQRMAKRTIDDEPTSVLK